MLTGKKYKYGNALWRIMLLAQVGIVPSAYAHPGDGVVGAGSDVSAFAKPNLASTKAMSTGPDLNAIKEQHKKVMAEIPLAAQKMMAKVEARLQRNEAIRRGFDFKAISAKDMAMKELPKAAQAMLEKMSMPVNLPDHPLIKAGTVDMKQYGHTLDIKLLEKKVAIDWDSFNIGKGNTVRIRQSKDAILLNNVTGHEPSVISGLLSAKNGQVWLSNPYGITLDGATIKANLLSTTKQIILENFLRGQYHFEELNPASATSQIRLEGEVVFGVGKWVELLGSDINVSGKLLAARSKKINLMGVESYTLDMDLDDMLTFKVNPETASHVLKIQLEETAKIDAEDGIVLMRTADIKDTVEGVVSRKGYNQSGIFIDGIIEANRVTEGPDGVIRLEGGVNTTVKLNNLLSSTGKGTTGGTIYVTADKGTVIRGANSIIDVSGTHGGGKVAIGGASAGNHGVKPEHIDHEAKKLKRADHNISDERAQIKADATDTGNGGIVNLWENNQLIDNSTISANGGPNGGSGGFIELSSLQQFPQRGDKASHSVNAGSKGETGAYKLDPDMNITISTNATTANGGTGTTFNYSVNKLQADLGIGNLTVAAHAAANPITFGTISYNGTVADNQGTIVINNSLDLTGVAGTNTLQLQAGAPSASQNGILIGAALTTGNHPVTMSTSAGAVTNTGFPMTLGAQAFTIQAQDAVNLGVGTATGLVGGGGTITVQSSNNGTITLTGTFNIGTGDLLLNTGGTYNLAGATFITNSTGVVKKFVNGAYTQIYPVVPPGSVVPPGASLPPNLTYDQAVVLANINRIIYGMPSGGFGGFVPAIPMPMGAPVGPVGPVGPNGPAAPMPVNGPGPQGGMVGPVGMVGLNGQPISTNFSNISVGPSVPFGGGMSPNAGVMRVDLPTALAGPSTATLGSFGLSFAPPPGAGVPGAPAGFVGVPGTPPPGGPLGAPPAPGGLGTPSGPSGGTQGTGTSSEGGPESGGNADTGTKSKNGSGPVAPSQGTPGGTSAPVDTAGALPGVPSAAPSTAAGA